MTTSGRFKTGAEIIREIEDDKIVTMASMKAHNKEVLQEASRADKPIKAFGGKAVLKVEPTQAFHCLAPPRTTTNHHAHHEPPHTTTPTTNHHAPPHAPPRTTTASPRSSTHRTAPPHTTKHRQRTAPHTKDFHPL